MKKRKVLLIGWDAADWKVIMPLVNEGKMPTFKKLMEKSAYGNIVTMDPPLSPMLWTSIATGKRAYDHGILGFAEPTEDGLNARPVQVTSRKVKAFWNILTQKGLKSNVVGWWPSHPAEPINGVMVSNRYQLATSRLDEEWVLPEGTIYPPSMEEELKQWRVHHNELTAAHLTPFLPNLNKLDHRNDRVLNGVAKILSHCASFQSATTYLLENTEWDFTAVYLDAIDHFSHLAMRYHPPQLPWVSDEDFENYKEVVQAGYRFHDMMLERLLAMVDEDTTIILLSDHGFHSDHLRLESVPKDPAGPAYEHRQFGVFLASGPGIKKGEQINGATLLDITPTLLHLYGLPVAKDMEGRVLQQIFEQPTKVETINSWEDVPGYSGMHYTSVAEDTRVQAEAVDQLAELGYIDKQEEDGKVNVELVVSEAEYYLARSYMDAGKHTKALPILQKLFDKYPDTYRYAVRYMTCLCANSKFEEAKRVLEAVKTNVDIEVPKLQYFEGFIALNTGKYAHAEKVFVDLLNSGQKSVTILNQVGKLYRLQEKWDQAIAYHEAGLELDPDDFNSLNGLGHCYYGKGQWELALEHFLDSTDHVFYQPFIHQLIGKCMLSLDLVAEAANAFETAFSQAPRSQKILQDLIDVLEKLGNQEKLVTYKSISEELNSKPVIVVSGLPRSGTSMMMQMLNAGGVEVLSDGERVADESNPQGYYELEAAKKLALDNSWVGEGQGKAVKVIAHLLPYLDHKYRYKVIFMQRPLHEVILSQQIMLGKSKEEALRYFPLQLANQFQTQIDKSKRWAELNGNVEFLEIFYSDVIDEPQRWSEQIAEFLGVKLNLEKMVASVNQKLHRNKFN